MLAEIKELWRFRELLFSMVQRELKIRYKNSFLGFLWSLLNPLITVLVMTTIFKNVMQNDTPNLGAYILTAYLPYMFFQLCLMDSAQSILGNIQLIKKIYFPREILPLASIFSNLIHFLLALCVLFLYLITVYVMHPGKWPFHSGILLLPLLLFINFCLSTGLALLISAVNTFYEDVKYIVSVLLYLMLFVCPIMYFSENVYYSASNASNPWFYRIYNLNPVAVLSTAYRKAILDPQPVRIVDPKTLVAVEHPAIGMDWKYVAIAFGFSILVLVFGYSTFNRLKWKFVERP
jgi:lipopolysaccharide transport system permease protein